MNVLTHARRRCIHPTLVTKIGDDMLSEVVRQHCASAHIDTSYLFVAKDRPTPFTFVIVDDKTHSRTCIHTPGDELHVSEVDFRRILSGQAPGECRFDAVYLDGRHTAAALDCAKLVSQLYPNIPLFVECERPREGLTELMTMATHLITSKSYALQDRQHVLHGMHSLLFNTQNRRVTAVVTTIGEMGAVLMRKADMHAPIHREWSCFDDAWQHMQVHSYMMFSYDIFISISGIVSDKHLKVH